MAETPTKTTWRCIRVACGVDATDAVVDTARDACGAAAELSRTEGPDSEVQCPESGTSFRMNARNVASTAFVDADA